MSRKAILSAPLKLMYHLEGDKMKDVHEKLEQCDFGVEVPNPRLRIGIDNQPRTEKL